MGGAMLNGITAVFEIIFNTIQLLMIAYVAVGLLGGDPRNPLVRFIVGAAEPLCKPFRKLTRKIPGPLDWSPMAVLIIIVFFQRGLFPYLRMLALRDMTGP